MTIEPTEEQKQAAAEWWRMPPTSEAPAMALARLLAEREAKLREEVLASYKGPIGHIRYTHDSDMLDTLRARVAELETEQSHYVEQLEEANAEVATLLARVAELAGDRVRDAAAMEARMHDREARHLADIKALRELLREARRHLQNGGRLVRTGTGLLDDIDRVLDDVKADAPVVTECPDCCGECDHVGECGDYGCRPGVDGWQLKAGAR